MQNKKQSRSNPSRFHLWHIYAKSQHRHIVNATQETHLLKGTGRGARGMFLSPQTAEIWRRRRRRRGRGRKQGARKAREYYVWQCQLAAPARRHPHALTAGTLAPSRIRKLLDCKYHRNKHTQFIDNQLGGIWRVTKYSSEKWRKKTYPCHPIFVVSSMHASCRLLILLYSVLPSLFTKHRSWKKKLMSKSQDSDDPSPPSTTQNNNNMQQA